MSRIIGFAGKRRAGKNTAMEWMQKRYGGQAFAFADELKVQTKRLLKEICGDDVDPWNDKSDKLRKFMQTFGTDLVRAYDSDAWVKLLMSRIDVHVLNNNPQTNTICYITDVRFANEATAIHDREGVIIGVWCTERIQEERILRLDGLQSEERSTHISENSNIWPQIDLVVNGTTPETLNDDMLHTVDYLRSIGWKQV